MLFHCIFEVNSQNGAQVSLCFIHAEYSQKLKRLDLLLSFNQKLCRRICAMWSTCFLQKTIKASQSHRINVCVGASLAFVLWLFNVLFHVGRILFKCCLNIAVLDTACEKCLFFQPDSSVVCGKIPLSFTSYRMVNLRCALKLQKKSGLIHLLNKNGKTPTDFKPHFCLIFKHWLVNSLTNGCIGYGWAQTGRRS